MAREPILIVDDTPVNLKLTRILLVNEGYRVRTAASAEEALELLRTFHPDLILADIQLPGMDGLEMTRRIKRNPQTSGITVVALTAFAMKGDEQKALDAGCDGYITKPIDTRTLGERIREYLDKRPPSNGDAPAPSAREIGAISGDEMRELRHRFLEEGEERARAMLSELDGPFDPAPAARYVHQWIGAGGLLGYSAISRLSREVETLLHDKPVDSGQLRESLTNLVTAFSTQRESRTAPVPEAILRALGDKRIAVVGLPSQEAERLYLALESANAKPVFFDLDATPAAEALAALDLVVTYVHPEAVGSPWLDPASPAARKPNVFVGHRDHLLALEPRVQAMGREFLMDSWQPDEALVRLSLALSQAAAEVPYPPLPPTARIRALVADDDPTVLALVRTVLENSGMECIQAEDGMHAIAVLRAQRPDIAVMDFNMPDMDGYEVLAAVRKEQVPTRILLLTARQQENDILRAFELGAEDYVVKPFSPMELAARLKRILAK
ncbi:MAG TPA: response regulator [Candidatus Solibacter sp.]|nr:response regulator [Candidatus Solibacter sp.]